MMQKIKKRYVIPFLLILSHVSFGQEFVLPRLTIIFIIDQLAYFHLQRMESKLQGGIGSLMQKGVCYENAFYPHAKPATATGHVALNTGVFAKDHGVVSNKWLDSQGKKIYFPNSGDIKNAAVFAPDGENTLDYARSAKRLMVPGVSDTFVLNPKAKEKNYVYAISLKDRSSIGATGRLGKPIWFDNKTGYFTSSKAYFDTLPDWVKKFNEEKKIYNLKKIKWEPVYGLHTSYYKFQDAFNYTFASGKQIIGTDVQIYNPKLSKPYKYFKLAPYANDVIFDLAQRCIQEVLYSNKNNRLVLWVSLSPLDKLGHIFGPGSAEILDMIYHIDRKMSKFMKQIQKKIKKSDILFVLTADHGICPIPELLQEKGLKNALRIDEKKLLAQVNDLVQTKFSISNLCIALRNDQIYPDNNIFNSQEASKKEEIRRTIKNYLLKQPGIKQVWTYDELQNAIFEPNALELRYKNQLYPGRSGEFIIQVEPFCMLSAHKGGTCHSSPYNYDTHVPLILYQKGSVENKGIKERVSMLQFSNSLAQILQIPKSPASMNNVLPGLFDKEN